MRLYYKRYICGALEELYEQHFVFINKKFSLQVFPFISAGGLLPGPSHFLEFFFEFMTTDLCNLDLNTFNSYQIDLN